MLQLALKFLAYAVIFGIILFFAHYTSKFIALKKMGANGKGDIVIKERVYLSKDKQLILVELKGKVYFMGVNQERFDIIDSFESKDDIDEKKL